MRVQVISKKAFPSGRICTSANYQNLSLFTRSTNICVSACDGEAYEVGVDGAVSSLDATLRYVTTHPGAAYTCAAAARREKGGVGAPLVFPTSMGGVRGVNPHCYTDLKTKTKPPSNAGSSPVASNFIYRIFRSSAAPNIHLWILLFCKDLRNRKPRQQHCLIACISLSRPAEELSARKGIKQRSGRREEFGVKCAVKHLSSRGGSSFAGEHAEECV